MGAELALRDKLCLVQARALSGDGSKWSIIQGLLALATLAAVALVPSLMALVPNFNGHILPSAPHKVPGGRYQNHASCKHRSAASWCVQDWEKSLGGKSRCTHGRRLCCLSSVL